MANNPTFKLCIKSNATVTESAEKYAPASVYATGSQEWANNPADAEAWEWADIDALQIGVAVRSDGGGSYGRCTQVYVEVDYTPAAGLENKSANMGAKLMATGAI